MRRLEQSRRVQEAKGTVPEEGIKSFNAVSGESENTSKETEGYQKRNMKSWHAFQVAFSTLIERHTALVFSRMQEGACSHMRARAHNAVDCVLITLA